MNTETVQLHGWKEIAGHFRRSVRCVQRWERHEKLPVRRHGHRTGVSVYAFMDELDSCWQAELLVWENRPMGQTGGDDQVKREVVGESPTGQEQMASPNV